MDELVNKESPMIRCAYLTSKTTENEVGGGGASTSWQLLIHCLASGTSRTSLAGALSSNSGCRLVLPGSNGTSTTRHAATPGKDPGLADLQSKQKAPTVSTIQRKHSEHKTRDENRNTVKEANPTQPMRTRTQQHNPWWAGRWALRRQVHTTCESTTHDERGDRSSRTCC
jgi:hypothetical protein